MTGIMTGVAIDRVNNRAVTTAHRAVPSIAVVACVALIAFVPVARAQGTAAEYRHADSLHERLDGLLLNAAETPTWLPSGSRFWYRKSVRGGNEFVIVDAKTLQKSAPFDHAKIALALNTASGSRYTAQTLPFRAFTFADQDRAIDVVVDSTRYRCTLIENRCATQSGAAFGRGGGGGRGNGRSAGNFGGGLYGDQPRYSDAPIASPDGKLEAFVRDYNVWVRTVGAKDAMPLSSDGASTDAYRIESIVWSPDSKKIAAYHVTPAFQREINYVISSPPDQLQPKSMTRLYSKPGDVLDIARPTLFDVDQRRAIQVSSALFPNPFSMSAMVWRRDSRAVTFEYNQRGHQVYRVIEINASNGVARAVISEEPKTFFTYSSKRYRYDVADGRELVWMSERDGWNHLYLYDGATGQVKNQITKGNWVVRGVDRVDSVAKQIWFRASGMQPGKDPYFINYYRINFDGTGLTTYTEADGNHAVAFSPDNEFYVDTWSRVDLPPVTQLRRTSDRSVLLDVEKADATALLATGFRAPEPFVAKGRDGTTDIYGIIVRPTNFDAKRKYPVIEYIYAGPHDSFVPKTYGIQYGMQAQAELGFIVVQIDGMGTSNRSKAFHDMSWQNIGDAGFPDRILWHKAVAAKYSYYDISRVGIYGGSAGGQNSLGALLFHPEFYKAAVSFAGCHDNRMDKIWWNEQWMGWPIGPQYAKSSNVDNAFRLQGKLLLIVGELDTNVDPSSTFQVVNALIKANKTFDMLVMPGEDHPAGRRGDSAPYGDRKQWDFFVHHLIGVEPPARNAFAAVPIKTSGDASRLLPGYGGVYGPTWESVWAGWGK